MHSFANKLIAWYIENKRDLPWRKTTHPYAVWLSEIILQQTRVEQGMPYYFAFLEKFPTVFDLAAAKESAVLKIWQGLGYYSRARNLHATAQKVAQELHGRFPDNYNELKKLKGVGDYTASAIASFCFNEPTAVVDGNVYRVLARIFGIDTPINSAAGQKEFKNLAQELMDRERPALFNQGVMEFGATHCKPKNPYCLHCPFNDRCVALQQGQIDKLPVKKGKTKVKNRFFNYLVYDIAGEKTILQQRTEKGIWRGLYEFPLIETQEEVGPETFRSLVKEQDNDHLPSFGEYSKITQINQKPILHKLSHQHLHVKFWYVKTPVAAETAAILREELGEYAVPRVIDKFLDGFTWNA